MKKCLLILFFLFAGMHAEAANYPLEVINIKPSGIDSMTTKNRIFRAYPNIEYNIRAAVVGGDYPYTFSFSANKPSWLNINSTTGEISGTAPASGTFNNISILVTDSAGSTTTATWSITISSATTDFIFLDAVNGNDTTGDGTLANPWKTLSKFYSALPGPNTIVYFRAGTYALFNDGGTRAGINISDTRPAMWIAYPGESPVINMNNFVVADGTGVNHTYFDGLEFTTMSKWGLRGASNSYYWTVRRSNFHDLTSPDAINNNYGLLYIDSYTGVKGYDGNSYHVIQDNKFHDYYGATGVGPIYKWKKLLIEDNEFYNLRTGVFPWTSAISIKGDTVRTTIRHNYFHDFLASDTISGYIGNSATGVFNNDTDLEICFNRFLREGDDKLALFFNNHADQYTTYFYRNTVKGVIRMQAYDNCCAFSNGYGGITLPGIWPQGTCGLPGGMACSSYHVDARSGDGPFYIRNNVIVNNTTGEANKLYFIYGGTNPYNEVFPTDNLVGITSSGIINSTGNLQGSYISYLGTRGYEILTGLYTIGGTVSGLAGTVILQNNGGDNKTITANGTYSFLTSMATGSTYNVTVSSQPAGQTCAVSNGSGTVGSTNVTNANVTCYTDVSSPGTKHLHGGSFHDGRLK